MALTDEQKLFNVCAVCKIDETLDKAIEALEHAIRVMEEEVYVTRDQQRAVDSLKVLKANIESQNKLAIAAAIQTEWRGEMMYFVNAVGTTTLNKLSIHAATAAINAIKEM